MDYFLKQFAEQPPYKIAAAPHLSGTMTSTRTIEGTDQDHCPYVPHWREEEAILAATMTITNTIEGHDQDRPKKSIFFE